MSDDQVAIEGSSDVAPGIHLASYNRISKLPMVESTYQTGKTVYDKVKDMNSITNWTMSTAENTICKVAEISLPYAMPVVQTLETPIKKVDGMICSGLDYVEEKVPAVKLPPGEVYTATKEYVTSSKPVTMTKTVVDPAYETAKNTVQGAVNLVEPAYEGAKNLIEPAVQSAKNIVEPYVQGTIEKAEAIKDYGTQKVDEYLHPVAEVSENAEADEDIVCTICDNTEKHEH